MAFLFLVQGHCVQEDRIRARREAIRLGPGIEVDESSA